jgi:hypothetical protein
VRFQDTEYSPPVSGTILSLTATKRRLQGKTYYESDGGKMYRVEQVRKLRNGDLVGDVRPVDSTIPTEMVHVAAIIDMLEHPPPEPAYSLFIPDPSSTISRSANRFAPLAFVDDNNEIPHLDYDSDSNSNSNNPVPPPRAMQLVPPARPAFPIRETYGPSNRLYYSAAYRARRARLRRTLRKQLL